VQACRKKIRMMKVVFFMTLSMGKIVKFDNKPDLAGRD
jgi:hypothetical protein